MVDRFHSFQIAHFRGIFFTVTSESHCLSRFLICHRPPCLTVTSGTTARCWVGWVRQKVIYWYVFSFSLSFFFLANFLFCSPVTALYPPCRWTWLPFPLRAHQPTTDHDDGNN